ncbi:DGQHR domain-containing protein [Anabaena cylindrica FACHB-243]|uniref:DGQHR domain protein n=1 Tax=Anabaena cylindrica (strain ATCC 27899 / PCC 7122) TaxID=272123 RepID=K9ZLU5_ANACC|nr:MULTISPECIES: DGQHR domain-containing protein [Anabaena]AFZ60198.1 DGQHR domain protein [Anabaena cylindrica PCC 7122]MBD2417749.1 DGQHR domain-containing protein [Anabaena cylindrica FACHB-243]MBY5282621.1 DGQHR domain-containing protein [Anabaena sp. CCAP 1446/1C]MBY5310489.1 DGQHR domain-containing protein [Anabaena sp. CCAP 1446/1C]MCM2404664.1 DGQHR domain-containing protein [Anabaena sp. CCAP 1446/1C]
MENKTYFGCLVRQRLEQETISFFVFYARVKDIIKWAGVRRAEDSKEGTQRVLTPTRKKAITRFVKSDLKNTIPNNILLAFEPGKAKFTSLEDKLSQSITEIEIHNDCKDIMQWGIIEFSLDKANEEYCAYVVDGQHRLYGLSDYDAEDLPILVVSLVNATIDEQAFQFIVINNKAVKVSTNNVKGIIANLNEEELEARLLKAGVKYGNTSPTLRDINDLDTSPFQNLLDWPYNKQGTKLVPVTAIEQSLKYLKTTFTFLEEDDDSLFEIFCAVWRAIKENYSQIWGEDNKFMKKVNINSLNEFIFDRLKFAWELSIVDIFDSEKLEKQVLSIVGLLPKEFWEAEWSIRQLQDSAAVRKQIKDDLLNLAENCKLRRTWYKDLKLPIIIEE